MKIRLSEAPGRLLPVSCDVTQEEEVTSAFGVAVSEFGQVDVLVNSAGLTFPETLLTGDTETWKTILEVTRSISFPFFIGCFFLSRN